MVKQTSQVLLPEVLIQDIERLPISQTYKDYALKFVSNLMRKSTENHGIAYGEVQIPRTWIRKSTNGRYNIWIGMMKDVQILRCNESYSNFEGQNFCKSYALHSKYFLETDNDTVVTQTLQVRGKGEYMLNKEVGLEYTSTKITSNNIDTLKSKTIKIKPHKDKPKDKFYEQTTKDLRIDAKALRQAMEQKIADFTRDSVLVNEEIQRDSAYVQYGDWLDQRIRYEKANGLKVSVKAKDYQSKAYSTIPKAIEKAKKQEKSIIQDGSKFYCEDVERYIDSKKRSLRIAYSEAIWKLEHGILYATRNKTNNRLDTNFTNLPKLLMDIICKDNDLVQIDLKNSQFAIFSHLVGGALVDQNSQLFKQSAQEGKFYELLQEKLEVPERSTAKTTAFELMFSKAGTTSALKTKLRESFPEVIEYIDEYKRVNRYKDFSIMLQKFEAELFIDGIYHFLREQDIQVLTKHDSIICKRNDQQHVLNTIQYIFDEYGFIGKLDIED